MLWPKPYLALSELVFEVSLRYDLQPCLYVSLALMHTLLGVLDDALSPQSHHGTYLS